MNITKSPVRDWTGNSKSAFTPLGASNHSVDERAKHDFYATDPAIVHQLLALETFAPNILEPCCGAGHIAKALSASGHIVQAQDLYDYGYAPSGIDFLTYEPPNGSEPFDIITNPPYSIATDFILHALEILPLYHRAAMLLRLQFLESADRYNRLYRNGSLEKVYIAAKRAHCAKNGDFENMSGNALCYAWFIWRKGYQGPATIGWFNTPAPASPAPTTIQPTLF